MPPSNVENARLPVTGARDICVASSPAPRTVTAAIVSGLVAAIGFFNSTRAAVRDDRLRRSAAGLSRVGMKAMSDAVGPGDLVLCVNIAPNHVTGRPVPLQAGETYRVIAVLEFACPCGRSDALLDVGVDFAWCQTRFRLLPKPKAQTRTRRVSAPREKETIR
jgi:hypothetical protein